MNGKSLDIHEESNKRLQNSQCQERNVGTPSPETPSQTRNDRARHESQPNKTEHVVTVRYIATADFSRGEQMAQKSGKEENEPDSDASAATRIGGGDGCEHHR